MILAVQIIVTLTIMIVSLATLHFMPIYVGVVHLLTFVTASALVRMKTPPPATQTGWRRYQTWVGLIGIGLFCLLWGGHILTSTYEKSGVIVYEFGVPGPAFAAYIIPILVSYAAYWLLGVLLPSYVLRSVWRKPVT